MRERPRRAPNPLTSRPSAASGRTERRAPTGAASSRRAPLLLEVVALARRTEAQGARELAISIMAFACLRVAEGVFEARVPVSKAWW